MQFDDDGNHINAHLLCHLDRVFRQGRVLAHSSIFVEKHVIVDLLGDFGHVLAGYKAELPLLTSLSCDVTKIDGWDARAQQVVPALLHLGGGRELVTRRKHRRVHRAALVIVEAVTPGVMQEAGIIPKARHRTSGIQSLSLINIFRRLAPLIIIY
jgi:hypothetical protein